MQSPFIASLAARQRWRDRPLVHPSAELFPNPHSTSCSAAEDRASLASRSGADAA